MNKAAKETNIHGIINTRTYSKDPSSKSSSASQSLNQMQQDTVDTSYIPGTDVNSLESISSKSDATITITISNLNYGGEVHDNSKSSSSTLTNGGENSEGGKTSKSSASVQTSGESTANPVAYSREKGTFTSAGSSLESLLTTVLVLASMILVAVAVFHYRTHYFNSHHQDTANRKDSTNDDEYVMDSTNGKSDR